MVVIDKKYKYLKKQKTTLLTLDQSFQKLNKKYIHLVYLMSLKKSKSKENIKKTS